MNLFCFGLSHQTATVDIRERFAIPDTALADSVQRLKQLAGVNEGVVLSTCNRTEVYVASDSASIEAASFLSLFYGDDRGRDASHLYRLSDTLTARHLFRVVAGLESMVIGETEIFGQVKRAYEVATEQGATGKLLNRLFQKSFQVGKQVRSKTNITRGSVSVGSVAVELAEQIFGRLAGCKIMILGAGDTSEKTARVFQARGARQIFVSNRSYERAHALAESMNGRAVRFDSWQREFQDLDILVSSTAAPHLLLTAETLVQILHNRRDRPLFIIDLAVPRDIDPEVHKQDGVYYYDIDALELIADRTLFTRRQEETTCAAMIERHVTDFGQWLLRDGGVSVPPMRVEWQRM
jgi:glutamyl-tRNA reductase